MLPIFLEVTLLGKPRVMCKHWSALLPSHSWLELFWPTLLDSTFGHSSDFDVGMGRSRTSPKGSRNGPLWWWFYHAFSGLETRVGAILIRPKWDRKLPGFASSNRGSRSSIGYGSHKDAFTCKKQGRETS